MHIISFGKNSAPINSYSKHAHKDLEIVLQLTGHVTTTVGDDTFLLSKGDILVIPPGMSHSGVSDVYFTNIYFQFEGGDFAEHFTVHDTDSGVFHLMHVLYKVLCKGENNSVILAESLADSIYQYIKKYMGEKNKYPVVAKLQDIINDSLDNPDFDLALEIGNTGFCPDYLRRCFKEDTGKTPLEYLTWLRLTLAKNLLIQDNFNGIANVALRCGFKDSFYFSTCFKKHTGLTPTQYRKKQKHA